MSWNKAKPADNEKLKDSPAQIRANWEALEAQTDPNLQVTNAKVAPGAGIAESKLAFDAAAGHDHSGSTKGKKIDVTAGITGVTPIANGGTGSSQTAYCDLTANVNGVLPVAKGGTGSGTKNFVDLTDAQTVAGVKTLNSLKLGGAMDCNLQAANNFVLGQTPLTTNGGMWYVP